MKKDTMRVCLLHRDELRKHSICLASWNHIHHHYLIFNINNNDVKIYCVQ